jgi:serine/threonine protein kinase
LIQISYVNDLDEKNQPAVLLSYSPQKNKIFNLKKKIYHQSLSSSHIYIAYLNDIKIAVKEIEKDKLRTPLHHEYVRNELAIHYTLSNNTNCENIVKVYGYYEDESKYYLAMELSPEPDYFENLLENVNFFLYSNLIQ